jgi:hypothetical protein
MLDNDDDGDGDETLQKITKDKEKEFKAGRHGTRKPLALVKGIEGTSR